MKGSKQRRTGILKIEGDEHKGTMEMRKASMQQRSHWPECLNQKRKRDSNCLDGLWRSHTVWSIVSYSVAIIIFRLDYNPLFAMQILDIG